MTLVDEKSRSRGGGPQTNNCELPDLTAIEVIQKNESTTFLQPTFAPKMMHLSKFLEPFDESALTDEDGAQKYSAYVAGFLKDQLSDQFDRHKNSAWFRDKYHPDYIVSKEKQRATLVARFNVFKKMHDEGFCKDISLEYKERAAITRLLDQFAILLAGGTSDDLAELDTFDPNSLMTNGTSVDARKQTTQASTTTASQPPKRRSLTPGSGQHSPDKKSAKRDRNSQQKKAKSEGDDDNEGNDSDSSTSSSTSSASSSAASSHSSSSSSSSSSAASSSHSARSRSRSTSSVSSSTSSSSASSSTSSSKSASPSRAENVVKKEETEEKTERKREDEQIKDVKMEVEGEVKRMELVEETVEAQEADLKEVPTRPPPIHVTRVVYLPYLPLSVHRATVETLLSEHPDFLRFACYEPTPIPLTSNNFLSDGPVSSLGASSLILHRPAWITFTATPTSPASTPPLEFIRLLVSRLRADSSSSVPSEASHLAAALSAASALPSPFNLDRVRASTRLATTLMATAKSTTSHFNPISSKSVMRRHLVMAARLVGRLDEVWAPWKPIERQSDWSIPKSSELDPRWGSLIGAASALVDLAASTGNPLLENLTDYLVDESNPDEEVMMLPAREDTSSAKEEEEEGDAELAAALDQLLLYLRLVYSVDFYAPALYPRESDMPHPCGILHVRPSKLPATMTAPTVLRLMPSPPAPVFGKEISGRSAHKVFARQISRIFRFVTPLLVGTIAKLRENEQKDDVLASTPSATNPAENTTEQQQPSETREMDTNERRLRLLGYRDATEVVEAFIKANTKRKKRKVDVIWVCPLSDKKFRGPGFVRKHILNKHAEKVEEAKKENAYFFNNFLLDPLRPELMRPPRRRLPVRKRNMGFSTAAAPSSASSVAEDDVGGGDAQRSRQQASGGGRDDLPPLSHSTRYWHSRSNGFGRSFSRGISGGTSQRRYGRPNPWAAEQRWGGGGGGSYHRHESNRSNGYRDLDAMH